MDGFNKMLRNERVNNLTTAVIFGFATLSFFSTVFTNLFGDWFGSGSKWTWSGFWTGLVVYVLLVIIAWWVHSQSKA